jgi:UMF1 family MFS transporter
MYDWANSAFVLVIVTAVFPIFYRNVPAAGLSAETATVYYGWTTTIVLALVAILAPVLGAVADFLAWRKRLLAVALFTGVAATSCMVLLSRGDWGLALLLFGVGNLGLSSSFVFYDSLLPHVAKPEEIDRVSTGGYALGYFGSGLLLILNLLWIRFPEWWGFSDATAGTRLAFLSVAIWWLVFSIPLLRVVREPARRLESGEQAAADAVRAALTRLRRTFRDFRGSHRQAFLLLLAVLVYSDGIGTIIRMAAIYATTRGLPDGDIILAILLVQFVGVPFSFLFGNLAGWIGTKRAIFVGLAVYALTTIVAFGMNTVAEFYLLAILVGTVQGGTQALSRSFFASMIPHHRTSEFFGFFSVSEKIAGIAGPLVFSLLLSLSGSSQVAILSILLFFVGGAALLLFVNETEGRREAEEAERRVLDPTRGS